MSKPLCIDLCCGLGGWTEGFLAEGYDVIGFDITAQPEYRSMFIQRDVRSLTLLPHEQLKIIVASPPCEEFSRHQMPWTKRRNPPEPDLSIVEACWRIAREAKVPIILENVRMAQKWLGCAKWHGGSFYLWGDVPALMPEISHRAKESYGSKDRAKRAKVPLELARYIARQFVSASFVGINSQYSAVDTDALIVKEAVNA